MDIAVSMARLPDGRWIARSEELGATSKGSTQKRCLSGIRRAIDRRLAGEVKTGGAKGEPINLVVEVLPQLAGVAEAARVMGWDKRRVITYIDRGRFPQPVQTLASGRIWRLTDVETFAAEWRSRQRMRSRGTAP